MEGVWPIYQYVQVTLHQGGVRPGAEALMTDCPWVRLGTGFAQYGWLWKGRGLGIPPAPDDLVGLTAVGLFHAGALYECNLFVSALARLASIAQAFKPSPREVQIVKVTGGEVSPYLFPRPPSLGIAAEDLQLLGDILRQEPSTLRYIDRTGGPVDGTWTLELDPYIQAYEGVRTLQDYADRLLVELSPPPPPAPAPILVSSLALSEALDYLNVIWLAWTKISLIPSSRFEVAAKLALNCATSTDFDSGISAICEVLDDLRPDGTASGHALERLGKYLTAQKLSPEAEPRVRSAIEDLEALYDLRVWRQHGVEKKGDRAALRLGLKLPTDEWGDAWNAVRARTVAALTVIREAADSLRSHSRGT